MEKYINEFLGEPDAPFADNTRLAYGTAIKQYLEWVKINKLDCLNAASIKEWFACLSLSGAKINTLHLKRSALRSFFDYCMDEGYITSNPTAPIKLKPVTITKKPIMTDLEVLKLCEISHNNLRDRAVIQLFVDSGLRISEICNLNIADLNYHSTKTTISPGKNRKQREGVLTYMAAGLIKRYLDSRTDSNPALFINCCGKRFTRQGMHKLFKRYSLQVNEIYSSHSCRWRFGTKLANEEFKVEEIADLMGHQVLQTTKRYVNLSEEKYSELHKRFNHD